MTWFEDLYNRQIFLDLYASEDTELAKREIDNLIEILEVAPGESVLDVCCGYGRHALELARRGFTVTGIDLASRQIKAARLRAEAEGLGVTFHLGDARSMTFPQPFQITLNLFTSFGFFLSEQEHEAMLARIYDATALGGVFLMDFWNREQVLRNLIPFEVESRSNGVTVEKRWKFDARNGRLNWENCVILPNGKIETWSQSIRAFTLFEMVTMLEKVGFDVEKVLGDWEGGGYTIDSPQMITLARRN